MLLHRYAYKPLSHFVSPMAAASVKESFDCADWIFESKLDGYRTIAAIDSAGNARIWSRNSLPFAAKFPMVQEAVSKLKLRSTIMDAEIVGLDEQGIPPFQLLQQWQKKPSAPYAFTCSISFGTKAGTSPARQLCKDVNYWHRS
jgi:ATP-dependent DNA ligase